MVKERDESNFSDSGPNRRKMRTKESISPSMTSGVDEDDSDLDLEPLEQIPRSIAIVSGKGGSGKTLIASVITRILDDQGISVILADADFGTAGLTFYLGLDHLQNVSIGLSNLFFKDNSRSENLGRIIKPIKTFGQAKFLSAGDFKRFPGIVDAAEFSSRMRWVVERLRNITEIVIFDCRGGLDSESLAVCGAVDEILLVVETDTTSYQATQRLVDILSEYNLADKLRGFMVNKVFDDPSELARSGTASFHAQYLTAIPFDFEVMRQFFTGKIPPVSSIFGIHVHHGLSKSYSFVNPPLGKVYRFEDYREIGLVNLDSLRGGVVVSLLIIALGATGLLIFVRDFYQYHPSLLWAQESLIAMFVLGLLGSVNSTRQAVGRIVSSLVSKVLLIGGGGEPPQVSLLRPGSDARITRNSTRD